MALIINLGMLPVLLDGKADWLIYENLPGALLILKAPRSVTISGYCVSAILAHVVRKTLMKALHQRDRQLERTRRSLGFDSPHCL